MIYIIAGVVAFIGWLLWAVIHDGRRLREQQALHRRRVEDYERERMMGEKMDDTKTWPGPEAQS